MVDLLIDSLGTSADSVLKYSTLGLTLAKIASPAIPVAFFLISSEFNTFIEPADSSFSSLLKTYAPLIFLGASYLLGLPLDALHLYGSLLTDSADLTQFS